MLIATIIAIAIAVLAGDAAPRFRKGIRRNADGTCSIAMNPKRAKLLRRIAKMGHLDGRHLEAAVLVEHWAHAVELNACGNVSWVPASTAGPASEALSMLMRDLGGKLREMYDGTGMEDDEGFAAFVDEMRIFRKELKRARTARGIKP